ncbi:SpoIIE family protein phosphatase [Geodermatophilus ruber]|uniref:Serine phosphatase RsbU, regulator of sigma subunit n=1 Tax=Geodermatophilus ruber TaxID=504800 RepID=A0A1I4EZ98_9ACTN|nr:SpoIIE family protein phosphatase [Geodermatophilus ruber]SFL09897.1 Serine phosphatase RsbU, regulator of sigma subunit [Geodermatophilus ruber]
MTRLPVPWRLILVVAAGYAAGSITSFVLFESSSTGAVLFLPAGVTLSALVLSDRRRWPWILATAAFVEVVIDRAQGIGPVAAWAFALANTAEPLVGALLLCRFAPDPDLSRRRDLGAFLLCGVLAGPLVGGLIGSLTIHWSQGPAVLDGLLPFWAGDGLGALTVGGAVLTWRLDRGRPDAPGPARRALLLLLTAGVTVAVFWPVVIPLAYLTIPWLFWLAVRYGVAVVTEAGLVVAVTANVMTVVGRGPWATLSDSPRREAAVLQLFIAVAVLSAWLLAVEIAERERARSVSRREAAARRRVEALQEVTAGLATAATTDAIAEVLVRSGIGLLADSGAVGVIDRERARLRVWTTAGDGAADLPLDDPSPLATAPRRGAAVRARSPAALAVPARAAGTTFGALEFRFTDEHAIDDDVAAMARTLAELMAPALHRARLYEEEREAAHQLQQSFLPVVPDQLPGAEFAGCYRPADQHHDIGGDWYDAFPLPGGRIGFAVGDVVGHDLRAAAAMGQLHSALSALAAAPHDGPAGVLDALDRASASIAGAELTTIGYGEYDPATCRLHYACAGHPPPLLVTDHHAQFLTGGRSRPLAAAAGPRSEATVDVPPGSMLLWYSDGLVERRDADLDTGLGHLTSIASRLDGAHPRTWCDALMRELTGGQRLHDDVVLICLRLQPSAPDAAGPQAVSLEAGRVPSLLRGPPDLARPQQPAPNPRQSVPGHHDQQ